MPAAPPGFQRRAPAASPAPPPGFQRRAPAFTPRPFEEVLAEQSRPATLAETIFGGGENQPHEPGILPSLKRTVLGDAPLGDVVTRLPGNIATKFGSLVTQQVAGAEEAFHEARAASTRNRMARMIPGAEDWYREHGLTPPVTQEGLGDTLAEHEAAGRLAMRTAGEAARDPRAVTPADAGLLERAVTEAAPSAMEAVPAALLTGGPGAAFVLGAGTGTQHYAEARGAGIDPATAARSSTLQGSLEALTEFLPAETLLKKSPGFTGFKAKLAEFFASELPGENVTTIAQMVDDYATGLRDDITGQDLLNAIADTTLQTVAGGGAQVATAQALQQVAELANASAEERAAGGAPPLEQQLGATVLPEAAPALPAPTIQVDTAGQAGTPEQHEALRSDVAARAESLGLGDDIVANLDRLEQRKKAAVEARITPALPNPATLEVNPEGDVGRPGELQAAAQSEDAMLGDQVAKLEAMGLTPDIIANLERLDARAEAARTAPPALPPPDSTVYVDEAGRAGTPVQQDAYRRAGNERAAQATTEAEAMGFTPDVAAAAFQREEGAQTGKQGAQTGKPAAPIALGDAIAPPPATTGPGKTGPSMFAAQTGWAHEVMRPDEPTHPEGLRSWRGRSKAEAERILNTGPNGQPVIEGQPAQRALAPPQGFVRRKRSKQPDATTDSALEFIAKQGGINMAEAEANGIDRADMRDAAAGIRAAFTKKGMSIDRAAELLHEAGYDVVDPTTGRYDANRLLDVIDRELRGQKSYSNQNETAAEEAEARRGESADAEVEARAMAERRAPDRAGPTRRRDLEQRKKVAAMTPDELRRELLTHELTGLPNRRAYNDAERLPHQVAIDVDSLKWVNDNMGHESGDQLLKAVGQALKEATDRAYHLSGDEFALEAESAEAADALLERIDERLAQATIEVTKADGSIVTVEGLGVSYGRGNTLKEADADLGRSKEAREASGQRAGRGQQPPGATIRSGRDEGRPDHEGDAPADQVREGVEEPTDAQAEAEREGLVAFQRYVREQTGLGEFTLRALPNGDIRLETMAAKETGRGAGTRAMDMLTDYADRHDKRLVLGLAEKGHQPIEHGPKTTSRTRLREFYKRFGFVQNKGRHKDFTLSIYDSMYRDPKRGRVGEPGNNQPRNQLSLFTQKDARPGTNAKQIALANTLLNEYGNRVPDPRASTGGFPLNTLAGGFAKALTENHVAMLVGQRIRSSRDLADLAQRYRDPRFETLRYIFMKGDRVIGETGVSSRLPGSSGAYPATERNGFAWLLQMYKRMGADGLRLLHNHPSGASSPSEADIKLTKQISRLLDIDVEHVVLDSNEYSEFKIEHANGYADLVHKKTVKLGEGKDELLEPAKPHRVLGMTITEPDEIVALGRMFQRPGWITVVGVTTRHTVRSIGEMPEFSQHGDTTIGQLKAALRRWAYQNGNGRIFLVGNMTRSTVLKELKRESYVFDAITPQGESLLVGAGDLHNELLTFGGSDAGTRKVYEKREGGERDLLGDDVEAKNKLAQEERERDARRSPNRDQDADTGAPGDLFTRRRQIDIDDVKEEAEEPNGAEDITLEGETVRSERRDVEDVVLGGHERGFVIELPNGERIDEGPWDTKAEAQRFLNAEVGAKGARVVPMHLSVVREEGPTGRRALKAVLEELRQQAAAAERAGDSTLAMRIRRSAAKLKAQHETPNSVQEEGDAGAYTRNMVKQARAEAARFEKQGDHEKARRYRDMADKIEGLHARAFERGGDAVNEPTGDRRLAARRTTERGGRRVSDKTSVRGDKGYARLAQKAIDLWNDKVGWRYGPLGKLPRQRDYLAKRYLALGNVDQAGDIAKAVGASLEAATAADREAVYDYLTNRDGDPTRIDDTKIRAAAVRAKTLIDKVGQKLVDLGLISQEAYDAHAGEYLPRLYLKHVLEDAGTLGSLGTGLRTSDQGYGKQRKDLDEETRMVILGEITDPAFLASFGLSKTLRDIALIEFLEKVAGNKQWVPQGATVEWRGKTVSPFWLEREAVELRRRMQAYDDDTRARAEKVAAEMDATVNAVLEQLGGLDRSSYQQIPNSNRYGALRGLWVRKEIYNDLVGANHFLPPNASVAESILGDGGALSKATSWWKFKSVLLNPPTQVRNFISNMPLLHLSGVPLRRVYSGELIGKAVDSIARKDRFYKIAKRHGLFATTFANVEGGRIRDGWIAAQKLKGAGLAKARAFAARAANSAGDVYALTEAVFKIAKIRDAMEREGKSATDAVLEAQEALFDYSLVPRSVRYARNQPLGAPFITFFYKALGQLAKTAVKHPLRFAPYAAIPYLLSELIQHAYDVDDDDLKRLRKAFPAWMRERGHMLLLPFKDDRGRWQVVDMGYLVPWGQMADMYAAAKEGKGGKEVVNAFALGGPLPDVISAIETNIDPFTGDQIVNAADPPELKLQALTQYVWNLAMPPFLTDRGAIAQYKRAIEGKNVNTRGEPGASATQAALRLFGINVYPVDPEKTRAANLRALEYEAREIQERGNELMRDKNLSDAEREELRASFRRQLERVNKRGQDYARESEINPKLK